MLQSVRVGDQHTGCRHGYPIWRVGVNLRNLGTGPLFFEAFKFGTDF